MCVVFCGVVVFVRFLGTSCNSVAEQGKARVGA
jgi:hypothetical protein